MELTSDPTEFEGVLRPGDVLAFDSLRMLSGLVQWADNAPTNHVGIIDDEGALVMANKTRPSETDPDPRSSRPGRCAASWTIPPSTG